MTQSEFGKGFIYNLILFAKHWFFMMEEIKRMRKIPCLSSPDLGFKLWFNGASDHFYELEIPPQWRKNKIGRLAWRLQDKCLILGQGSRINVTEKDYIEVFEKLEELCLLIDKELGIKPKKAKWN